MKNFTRMTIIAGLVFIAIQPLAVFSQDAENSENVRYKFFQLNNLSAKKAQALVNKLGIGTVSLHPKPNTVLVTAEPDNLRKASIILKIIDTKVPYIANTIAESAEKAKIPEFSAIEAMLGDIVIGTFTDVPESDEKNEVIIDTLGGSVVAVAPVKTMLELEDAIEKVKAAQKSSKKQKTVSSEEANTVSKSVDIEESNKPDIPEVNTPEQSEPETENAETDQLFNQLLDELSEKPEPNEPEKKAVKTIDKDKNHPADVEKQVVKQDTQKPAPAPEQSQEPKSAEPEHSIEESKKLVKSKEIELRAEIENAVGIAQRSYEPQDTPLAEQELELDLPESLKIIDLLDLVGKYLHLDYMYDPAEVRGEVTLRIQGAVKVKELYPLVESVLSFRGLVMSRKGNLVTIVPKTKVFDVDPALLESQKGNVQYGDVIVTRVFELDYADTASAKNLLAQMKIGIQINEIADTGTIIVTGYAYRMPRVERLLEMIDRPGETKEFRYRQLEYTIATDIATKLQTLMEKMGDISITVSEPAQPQPKDQRRRRPQPKPAQAQGSQAPDVFIDADERTNRLLMIGTADKLDTVNKLVNTLDVAKKDMRILRLYELNYVGAEEVVSKLEQLGVVSQGAVQTSGSSKGKPQPKQPAAASEQNGSPTQQQPQIVVVESTNSLLVNASSEQHAEITTILGYVDSETQNESLPYVVYSLENKDPEELAGTLNELIKETIQSKDKEGKIQKTTTKKTEDTITIVPDKETYSLIVYANKKNQQWISTIIKQLDQYRPQVLLDVTLVQVTKTDSFNFDLEILSSLPNMEYTSGQISGVDSTVYNTLMNAKDRSNFQEFKSSAGEFKGFYGDEKINALLTAMKKKDYGRVMARPKLLVNDNEEGTIETTTTTYVKKIEQNQTTGDNPVLTESVDYPDYSAGITLTITPHISTGNMLRLEITLNRSGFLEDLANIEGDKPPDKSDADITTIVTAPDGHTIILGGMEKIDTSKGGSKVPILGDLPLIGGLFREVSRSSSQDKLYIFVKAHILRPGADQVLTDLKNVSRENRGAFEKLEAEMQKYESWPGVKAKTMDPEKVLERD